MMEKWNAGILGIKSGKKSILLKMLYLHIMMATDSYPSSAFAPENMPRLRKTKYYYIYFDSLSHHSIVPEPIIPIFQLRRSPWLESYFKN
jgi:hypothetical protein